MCHSWGASATARAHVQDNDAPDLENGWTDCSQTWYIDRNRLVGWRGKVNWDLPFRVTVPDLENGWTDCVQIWYTVSDRLAGCRAQASWRYPVAISHVQGPLISLAPLVAPKGVILVCIYCFRWHKVDFDSNTPSDDNNELACCFNSIVNDEFILLSLFNSAS